MSADPTPAPGNTDLLQRTGYAVIAVGLYSDNIGDRDESCSRVLRLVFCN